VGTRTRHRVAARVELRRVAALAAVRRAIDEVALAAHRRRRQVQRSPLGRRLARRRAGAIVLAALLGWSVAHQVAAAREAERSWGRTEIVLVATQPLDAGDVLDDSTTTLRRVPSRFVPQGALRVVPDHRRTGSALGRGEMVVTSRLAAPGLGATAAGLPDHTHAVTVALGEPAARVRQGDVVDAFAVLAADLALAGAASDAASGEAMSGLAAQVVAHRAVVVSATGDSATLAVTEEQVAATVGANVTGRLQLVVVG
jgi:Flp pilus assembly protein CpaB